MTIYPTQPQYTDNEGGDQITGGDNESTDVDEAGQQSDDIQWNRNTGITANACIPSISTT